MYQQFENLENTIATRTDLRLLLEDPDDPRRGFVREVNVVANGTMTVRTGTTFQAPSSVLDDQSSDGNDAPEAPDSPDIPEEADTVSVLTWTVAAMSAAGSSILGEIRVSNYAGRPTFGTVQQLSSDSPFPARLNAEVCAVADIPGYGLLHTATSVPISADINTIPPFGVEAAHNNSAILVDEDEIPRGMIVGRSITLIGPDSDDDTLDL